MSQQFKKELKRSVKECSSAMQTHSENIAEALKNNSFSNHLTEQALADLKRKVITFDSIHTGSFLLIEEK